MFVKRKVLTLSPLPPAHCGRGVPFLGGEGGLRVKCDLPKWGSKCANWATPSILLFLAYCTQVLSVNLVHICTNSTSCTNMSVSCAPGATVPFSAAGIAVFFFTTSKSLSFFMERVWLFLVQTVLGVPEVAKTILKYKIFFWNKLLLDEKKCFYWLTSKWPTYFKLLSKQLRKKC